MARTRKGRSTYFDQTRQLLDRLASSDAPLLGRWNLGQDGSGG
jgi:hypothetical protein